MRNIGIKALLVTLSMVMMAVSCHAELSGNAAGRIPERVISLAPSVSQIIVDMGMGDRLVAIDTQTPNYVQGLEGLEQFDMMAPDIERLAALEADVVFVSGMSTTYDDPYGMLEQLGVNIVRMPSSGSIEEIKADVMQVAESLGAESAGQALVEEMERKIDAIAAIGKGIETKKRVLFEISPLPELISFGRETYLDEMLTLVGAENVLSDEQGWISLSEEQAVSINPDVILTLESNLDDPVGEILARPGWQSVNAVVNREVFSIKNPACSLPNHRVAEALLEIAVCLYPDEYEGLTV